MQRMQPGPKHPALRNQSPYKGRGLLIPSDLSAASRPLLSAHGTHPPVSSLSTSAPLGSTAFPLPNCFRFLLYHKAFLAQSSINGNSTHIAPQSCLYPLNLACSSMAPTALQGHGGTNGFSEHCNRAQSCCLCN